MMASCQEIKIFPKNFRSKSFWHNTFILLSHFIVQFTPINKQTTLYIRFYSQIILLYSSGLFIMISNILQEYKIYDNSGITITQGHISSSAALTLHLEENLDQSLHLHGNHNTGIAIPKIYKVNGLFKKFIKKKKTQTHHCTSSLDKAFEKFQL